MVPMTLGRCLVLEKSCVTPKNNVGAAGKRKRKNGKRGDYSRHDGDVEMDQDSSSENEASSKKVARRFSLFSLLIIAT